MSSAPASFYVTGGTLQLGAPSYVERKADQDLLAGLQAGEFCYVLTSRQMGKSSLMVRTANKLQDRDVVVLDLSALGQHMTREQWYNGLLTFIGEQLRLEDELDEFWAAHRTLSPVQRWFQALTKTVLLPRSRSVVIFIDEIDVVRSLPFSTDEFFAAIRESYNRRARDPEFNRLTFCLLGVATPSDLVRNTNLTPFNIGRRIELNDFTPEEAQPLARGLHPQRASAHKLLARVLYWTNGHPYLTQRLCQALARDPRITRSADVDRLCDELFLSSRARERDDNLIFVRERMLRSDVDLTALLELYLAAWHRRTVFVDESSPVVSVLRLSGIVRIEGGSLLERNRIYRHVFDRDWVRSNLPDAELRRQRAAYRKGVLRATAIASVVVIALTVAIFIAVSKAKDARVALAKSYVSQAEAQRVSRTSGQRYESVEALQAAKRDYPYPDRLRNHMIASLALPDLKPNSTKYRRPEGPGPYEFSSARRVCAAATTKGAIVVLNLADDKVVQTIPEIGSTVTRLRFGTDAAILLAEYRRGSSNHIVLWDWLTASPLFALPYGIHAEAIDFSPDGKKLAIGQNDGKLTIYSLPDGSVLNQRLLKLNPTLPRRLQVLRFDPSGEHLAESSLADLNVQIWTIENLRTPLARFYHADRVYDLAWHPAGEFLATACGDSVVYLWDTTRPDHEVKKFAGHESKVTAITFDHSGTRFASAGDDETVRLWTFGTAASDRHLICRTEGQSVERLRFTAGDRELLATSGENQKPRLWDVFGEEYKSREVHPGSYGTIENIDFSPDGKWLAAALAKRTAIWDSTTGAEIGTIETTNANAAMFSANQNALIVSTGDGLYQYKFNIGSDGNKTHLQSEASCILSDGSKEPFRAMALTVDRTAAAIVQQLEVLLVTIGTNCPPDFRSLLLGKSYQRLCLHPNSTWLAASSDAAKLVDIWNLAADATNRIPVTLSSSPYFAFSPDGRWFVSCTEEGFHFFQVGAWTKPAFDIARKPKSDQHAPVAFSGSIIALAASRYTVQLLHFSGDEIAPPKAFATLEGPDRCRLEMLAFSPDGCHLAAATADRTIQIWNLSLLRDDLAKIHLENSWPKYEEL